MMKKLKYLISSIGIKLFFAFWLITLVSILVTHIVTQRLAQQSVILPLNVKDVAKLSRIAERINERQLTNLKKVVKFSHDKTPHTLLFKDPKTNEVFFHRKRYANPLAEYLEKNIIVNQSTIQFSFARITGPATVFIGETNYQLYMAKRVKDDDVSAIILLLPRWARFIMPITVSMLICFLFAKYLTTPVRAMEKTALKIGNGDYQARVNGVDTRKDELGQLAKSFNSMAEKLESNRHAHQRLLADVSHELRSPLTRLQITLGLIDKSLPSTDNKQKLLTRCEKEITQLDEMISNVLTLSRYENSMQATNLSSCNMTQFMQTIIDDANVIATEKGVTIKFAKHDTITLNIDQTLLYSAINNVVTNAIKYSTAKQTIDVLLICNDTDISITIADQGPGVENEHLSKLFEPFYRTSDARDRDSGGAGLGLAIAKQAVDAHNGSIHAINSPAGGLSITISLPHVIE